MTDPDARPESPLKPVPQTAEAFELLRALGDPQVAGSMVELGRRVREVAPDTRALSLSLTESGLTFTLVADQPEGMLMDAVQYLDGGPCVDTLDDQQVRATDLATDALDEARWALFDEAGRRLGIVTSLSLPVLEDDRVVAGVNLYGTARDAFDGRHEELARRCGAWAGGAVTNADLDFDSRLRAAAAPDRILDRRDLDLAAGLVSELQGIEPMEAVRRIRSAASRAGISEAELARFVLDAHAHDTDRRRRDG